jgi:site-specific DNA recombinase
VPKWPYSKHRQPATEHIRIPVPALVDADLFAAVQERLQDNGKRLRQTRHGPSCLLQGLVVCSCCGYAVYGQHPRRPHSYYRCGGRDACRFGGRRVCDNPIQRAEDLEAAVWNDVRALLSEPDRLRYEFERRQRCPVSDQADADRERLRATITKVKQSISRLIDAYTDGLVVAGEFEPRIRRLKERLAKFEGELQGLTEQAIQEEEWRVVCSRLDDFADQIKAGLTNADWAQRREILKALVKRVEVDNENIRIVYKVPAGPFAKGPSRGLSQDCWSRKCWLSRGFLLIPPSTSSKLSGTAPASWPSSIATVTAWSTATGPR